MFSEMGTGTKLVSHVITRVFCWSEPKGHFDSKYSGNECPFAQLQFTHLFPGFILPREISHTSVEYTDGWIIQSHRKLLDVITYPRPGFSWITSVKEAPGGRLKNTYELLNLRALKISMLH